MKFELGVTMKLFLFAALALSWVASADDDVVVLTDNNFDDFVKANDRVLVEFYAPWCGHCKRLEPEYQKAAAQLKEEGSTTVIAKVDATAETKLAKQFEIRGFPTLKYFTNGEAGEYGGGRDQKTIVSWVKKRELPAVSNLASKEELDTFTNGNTLAVVGFFEEGSDDADRFSKFADAQRDNYVFGVAGKDTAEAAGAAFPGLVLYRGAGKEDSKFESASVAAEAWGSDDDIKNFLLAEKFPLIDEIGPDNYRDYMDRGLPLVWIAVDPKDDDGKNTILKNLEQPSKDQKGKLSFTYVDGVQYEGHVKNLGIDSTPGLVIVNSETNEKFRFSGDLTSSDDVTAFFAKYGAGEIEAFLKSEPIPEPNDEDVFVIVGNNFKETAYANDKNVFVEFYAPWCGHCKKLAPEYDALGAHFKGRDDVVIAKVDATANDTPENISGFPTLIFYPAGEDGSKSVKYESGRTSAAMIKWIEEKAPAAEAAAEEGGDDAAAEEGHDEL